MRFSTRHQSIHCNAVLIVMKRQTDEYIIVLSTFQTTLKFMVIVPSTFKNKLTPLPLAENNARACALIQTVKNTINASFEDVKPTECLVVSSHVSTLKHEAKHRYITQKRLFVSSSSSFWVISMFSFVFLCWYMRGHH